jgi:O-antigen ligase/tetratricopeptide (TPR) repeat protein
MTQVRQIVDGWGTKLPVAECGAVGNFLLRVVDFGLMSVICVAPFVFGGRHDLGRLVLVSLIAVTAGAWFLRQSLLAEAAWPRTSGYTILILAAALLVLQIVPLPAEWIPRLSPNLTQLLPLWSPGSNDAVEVGTWRTLSLIPHETVKSLAMLMSYGLLFSVVAGRIQTIADVRRLLGWVGLAATTMAVFGIVQNFTSGGRFFWFYAHPYRSASSSLSGAFINRNHFAHFLILGIGPLAAWLLHVFAQNHRSGTGQPSQQTAAQRLTAGIIAIAIVVVVLASLASRSRGGAVVLVAAAAVLVGIYFWRGIVDSRFLYGLVGLTAVVIAVLSWHGYDNVVDRLDDLTEVSIDELDRSGIRRKIWAANIASIESFPLVGAGAGSHREICPVYLSESLSKEYTHAENGYLQILTESGIAGGVLLFAAMGSIGWWCVNFLRNEQPAANVGWFGAAAAGLAASAVHSLVDFVWYIPACMSATIVLAGCVLRLSQLTAIDAGTSPGMRTLPRGRCVELAAAAILIGALSVHTYFGPAIAAVHWDRYLRASVASSELSDDNMAHFVSGKELSLRDAERSLSKAMLRHLEGVVQWDPQFARAHRRLADRYLAEFELGVADAANVLEVSQIRDAAAASSFKSPSELRSWLINAFGSEVQLLYRAQLHARRAIALCPLQGDVYLRLAELAFLDSRSPRVMEAYVEQGLRVRPNDRNVLTRAGRHAFLMGRFDQAVKYWTKCFDTPGRHQQEIIYRFVTAGMPAKQFLESFHPNWQTLRKIWDQYKKNGKTSELNDVLEYAEVTTQREVADCGGTPSAHVWYRQSQLYADAGRDPQALDCLQRAYACDPRQYFIRRALAKALQAAGQFVESEPHVRWCLARRPSDKSLRTALEATSKARVEQRRAAPLIDRRWKPRVSFAKPTTRPVVLRN